MKIKTKSELEASLSKCETYIAEIEELSKAINISYPSDKPLGWRQICIRLLKILSTEYSVKRK